MNRTMLSRGQKVDTKEWVEGSYHKVMGFCYILKHDIPIEKERYTTPFVTMCGNVFFQVIPETVGQYWKKDKNEKRMFAGDKIKVHQFLFDGCEVEREHIAIVEIDEDGFCLRFISGDWIKNHTSEDEHCCPVSFVYGLHEESFEVIGTKWDETL